MGAIETEEVTEAMIEAGAAILEADAFVADATLEVTRRGLARQIYLAMLSAKKRSQHPPRA